MPIFPHTSATATPASACFKANTICDSVNFDLFMAIMSFQPLIIARLSLFYSGTVFREEVRLAISEWLHLQPSQSPHDDDRGNACDCAGKLLIYAWGDGQSPSRN